ncbi:MAG TPA: AsmA-like C-terminal domain-containing protein [Methyloceanibacter sp.]|nr:AsmA-like C-terminal domain-containing protein [Methyloceanibacter sp.]
MNEPISGTLDRLTTQGGRVLLVLRAQARILIARVAEEARRWTRARRDPDGDSVATNEPIGGALVKLTNEGRKVILALPGQGRALVQRVPEPVQVELRKLSSRSAHVCREIFAGILVVGLVAIVLGYGRLGRGPISLHSLVPTIEAAINGELSDVHVKIDDAILQRAPDGPGVLFRLRNIRLVDKDGSILAQAPFAAIGMSGSALLSGRVAPGSVDFIGPRLILFYDSTQGLALRFSRPAVGESEVPMRGAQTEEGGAESALPPPASETAVAKQQMESAPGGQVLDVTRTVSEVFESARSGNSSYLTRFGVKDALVVLNQNGTETSWQVPDFSIDLEHKSGRRSILVGQANFASTKGDWQLEFRAAQQVRRQSLGVTALIQNLVPSGLAGNFSSLGVLKTLDMVINGEANVELSNSGEFLSGEAKLDLESGQITPPWDRDSPLHIDRGKLNVRYLKESDVVEIARSTLVWGQSRATFSGEFRPVRDSMGIPSSWNFTLKADPAVLAIEEAGLAPMQIDEWQAAGNIAQDGRLTISRFVIRSGTASIELSGSVVGTPGAEEVRLAGLISPMSVDQLKRLWPKFLAGKARAWVLERVAGGEVRDGKFTVNLGPADVAMLGNGGELPAETVNVELNIAGMSIAYIPKMPPVITKDARLTVNGMAFSVDIPEGKIVLPSQQEIALSEGRFFIPDLREDPQQGEITFKADAATPTVLQLLDHEPLGYLQSVGLKPDFLGGTAEGGFNLTMPLLANLEFNQIKMRGAARLNDAIASNLIGNMEVGGGTLDVNITEQALEAKGAISIKGVPAELAYQRIFYTPDERQPPLKVTARLDAGMREKLGMKVNHLVHGPTPVTLQIARLGEGTPSAMRVQADLAEAQLLFGGLGWTKPAGRAATLMLDVVPKEDGSTDLANLQILGDDINIQGGVALDPEQHLKEFYFSDFSVNAQTHVEITARVRDDQVLEIKAEGPNFDGKQFFQSLFSAGQLDGSTEPDEPFGLDLTAEIGSVAGFYDATIDNVQVTVKKRNGRLVALDAKGDLNGRAPVAVHLEQSGGARIINAESRDAGAAFRVIGFYPSVEGGEASLQVNLDAGGPGSKSGTLWAREFVVLGDSVVNDVLTDPNSAAVLGDKRQQVVRHKIVFNQLRAPFTVGAGKFRLKDAYMNGPMLGATMRGSVDFKAQTVDLGGTYVPLYGLNSALGSIPILGRVLVGRQGEGVVGITFAIKGKLDEPTVLVNPMSVMTPGIFRQIFEFTGSVPDPGTPPPPSTSSFREPGAHWNSTQ